VLVLFFFLLVVDFLFMTHSVGVYRGSFDPPHKGHLEVVEYALKKGMDSVSIVYKDTNRFKPFRSSNAARESFLKAMFAGMPNVVISEKSYKGTIADLSSDPTVAKVQQIIGSDILHTRARPASLPSKLSYFVVPRLDYPIESPPSTWNNLPAEVGDPQELEKQNNSSSKVRNCFFDRNMQAASEALPPAVFEEIVQRGLFFSTDKEYQVKDLFLEVKKDVEKEIGSGKLVSEDSYPLSFHLGSDMGISGLSGDIICFVKDKEGDIVLVTKVFIGEDHRENYESELLGYQTIAELDLNLVKVPNLLFSGSKENFDFIGMSFVKGETLANMLRNPEALRLCAQANRELHLARRGSSPAAPLKVVEAHQKRVASILESLDSFSLPKEMVEALSLKWNESQQSFLDNPGLQSFTHGDPNHSNWIVDLESNTVTYIDLSLFGQSVSPSGEPSGFPINELTEALLTFQMVGKREGLSKEQIQEVKDRYLEEYMAGAPKDITTPEAKAYFELYWELRVMKSLMKKIRAEESIDKKEKYQGQLLSALEKSRKY
jgi:nicotinic acid mononucleotide adenylyltransferase